MLQTFHMIESEFSEIVNLIEDDKILQALTNLSEIDNKNIKNTTILLKRRLKENVRNFNAGLLKYEEASVEKNRISLAILDIISDLESSHTVKKHKQLTSQFYTFGNINLKNGEYYKAILYLTKTIISNPKHVDAYVDRGVAKYSIGSYLEAIQDFKIAIELSPYQPFALHNLGISYYKIDDIKEACSCWKKVNELGFDISNTNLKNICEK